MFRCFILTFIIIIPLLICGSKSMAQGEEPDTPSPFSLGFSMGVGMYKYTSQKQLNQINPSTGIRLKAVNSAWQQGIYLALTSSLRLSDHLDLRCEPSVSLEQYKLQFVFALASGSDSVSAIKTETAPLNVPLLLRIKTSNDKRIQFFMKTGLQYSYNLNRKKIIQSNPSYHIRGDSGFSFVTTFGIELQGEKVKLSPEIRYVCGIGQQSIEKSTAFPYSVPGLRRQALLFTLSFE